MEETRVRLENVIPVINLNTDELTGIEEHVREVKVYTLGDRPEWVSAGRFYRIDDVQLTYVGCGTDGCRLWIRDGARTYKEHKELSPGEAQSG